MKCSISTDQLRNVRSYVGKLLENAPMMRLNSPKDFVNDVYQMILKSSNDKVTALDYSRQVPGMILQIAVFKPKYLTMLNDIQGGAALSEMISLTDSLDTEEKGLQAVADYLNITATQEIYNYLKGLNENSVPPTDSEKDSSEIIVLNNAREQPSLLEDFINDEIQLENADSVNAATDELVALGQELDAIDVLADDSKWRFGELRLEIDGRLIVDVFANGKRFLMYKSTGTGTTADTKGEWTPLLYFGTRLNKKNQTVGWFVKAIHQGQDPKKNKYGSKTFIGLDSLLKVKEDELFYGGEETALPSEIRRTKNQHFEKIAEIESSKIDLAPSQIIDTVESWNGGIGSIKVRSPFTKEDGSDYSDLTFWSFHFDKDFAVTDALKMDGTYSLEIGQQIIESSKDQEGMLMPEVVYLTKTINNERFILGVLGETDTDGNEKTLADLYKQLYVLNADSIAESISPFSIYNQSDIVKRNNESMMKLKKQLEKFGASGAQPSPGVKREFDFNIPTLLGTSINDTTPDAGKNVLSKIIENVNDPNSQSTNKLLAVNVRELDKNIQEELLANSYITQEDIDKGTVGLMPATANELQTGSYIFNTYDASGESTFGGQHVYFSMQGSVGSGNFAQSLAKAQRISLSEANYIIEQELAVMKQITEHVNSDPKKNRVALNISNGSKSIIIKNQKLRDTNDMALVSKVKEKYSILPAFTKGETNTLSIKFTEDDGEGVFELEKPAIIDSAFMPTIEALYFNQGLKKPKGGIYGTQERIKILSSLVAPALTNYDGKRGNIVLKEDGDGFSLMFSGAAGPLYLSAEQLSTEEGKKKALARFYGLVRNRVTNQQTKVSYPSPHAKLNASNKYIKNVSEFPSFNASENTIEYRTITPEVFLSEGGFRITNVPISNIQDGLLKRSTPYITFNTPINVEVVDKSRFGERTETVNKIETEEKKTEEKKIEEKEEDDDDPLNISKVIRDLRASPSGKDIIFAEEWHKTSPLKKVVPFELLWGKINSTDPSAYAEWNRSGITLFKGADWTDVWHESWHAFSQGFLTKKEKEALYNEVRKYGGSFVTFKGKTKSFESATNKEIEEYLAEEFRTYMISGQKTTKGTPKKNGFFRKIWNALKGMFSESSYLDIYSNPMSNPLILETFNKLKSGNFSVEDFSYKNNAIFGSLNLNVMTPSDPKALPMNYRDSGDALDLTDNFIVEWIDMKNAGRSAEEQDTYISLKDMLYASQNIINKNEKKQFLEESIKTLKEKNVSYTASVILNEEENITKEVQVDSDKVNTIKQLQEFLEGSISSYDRTATNKYSGRLFEEPGQLSEAYAYAKTRFIALSEREKEDVIKKNEKYGNIINAGEVDNTKLLELQQAQSRLKLLNSAVNNFGDIRNPKIALTNGYSDLIGFHILNSNFFDDMEYFAQESIAPELVSRTGYVRTGNEDSLKALAKGNIIYMFSTLPKYDDEGKLVFNKFGVSEKESVDLVWNNVAKITENTPDFDRFLEKLEAGSREDKNIKEIFKRLGTPDQKKSFTENGYWTDLWQAFNKARVSLIQVTIKKEGELKNHTFLETVGEAFGADKKIGVLWNSIFKGSQPNNPFVSRDKEGNFLNTAEILKRFPNKKSIETAEGRLAFFRAIGINLSNKRRILDSITNRAYNPQYFWERISAIENTQEDFKIRELSDLYSELDLKGLLSTAAGGNAGTWNSLIKLEARYGDHVNNYMVSNAEGNSQFEHQLNNSMSMLINDVNDSKDYFDVINKPHLEHLNVEKNPWSNYNTLMSQMFYLDKNKIPKGKQYGDRTGNRLELKNLSGLAFEQNEEVQGKSSASADEYTKIIMDMALFKKGYFENVRHADKGTSYMVKLVGPTAQDRHVKLNSFKTLDWQNVTVDAMLPALHAEMSRISILKGYEKDGIENYDFKYLKNGQKFQAFDKILTEPNKEKLLEIVELFDSNLSFAENISINQDAIKELVSDDIIEYFKKRTRENNKIFEKVDRFSYAKTGLTPGQLITAFTVNNWLHHYETSGLIYGDIALYNHVKQEFHKRNAGAGSTGTIFRTDEYIKSFINKESLRKHTYAEKLKRDGNLIIPEGNDFMYGETLNTAIAEEMKVGSIYYNELVKKLGKEKADAYAEGKMEEADAQGLITFDSYRALSIAQNEWGTPQEKMFRDIVNGVTVDPEEATKFFPVRKLQYWGPLATDKLSLVGMHKYSLMPLIPSVIAGTKAEDLHKKMLQENIQYLTFESGSKISTITKNGTADKLFKAGTNNRTLIDGISNLDPSHTAFTKNTIYIKYLKNQLDIANKDKGNVVFSTQLRKLVTDGLLENEVPTDFKGTKKEWEEILKNGDPIKESNNYRLLKEFEGNIQALAGLYKKNLLKEIGISFNEDTKEYEGNVATLVEFMKKELKDDLPDHAISFINKQGSNSKGDLSLSFYAAQIEKTLNSILVKRLVTSKVNGEALVQVASTLFENKNAAQSSFSNPTDADKKEYGTNDLRFYREGPDGETLPIDVKIALRGKFKNLLDLQYNGARIGNIDTLNIAIKDEAWLSIGDNKRMITMTAVRIPVQGLNSMEFMQVRQFLPAEAGNIIIAPSEVVAKSGADFDVDKMTVMMPNIDRKVNKEKLTKSFLSEMQTENPELDFSKDNVQMILDIVESNDYEALTEPMESLASIGSGQNLFVRPFESKADRMPVYMLTESDKKVYNAINSRTLTEVSLPQDKTSKSGIENRLIDNVREILSLKSNFANLTTPNSTALFTKPFLGKNKKSLVDEVGAFTKDIDFTVNELTGIKGSLSPTTVFEYAYNLSKQQENKIGKEALGLGAVDNTYNILFNNVGAYMNPTNSGISLKELTILSDAYVNGEILSDEESDKLFRTMAQSILLDHNSLTIEDEKVISLSNLKPKGVNEYSISDVINQLMNGWVDVAKKGWVFDIQATKEISPTLLAMVQAGVPIDQAIYFVANPLTRVYVEKQKFVKSIVYDAIRRTEQPVNKRNYRNIALYELLMDPKYDLINVLRDSDLINDAEHHSLVSTNGHVPKTLNSIISKIQHRLFTSGMIKKNQKFSKDMLLETLKSFNANTSTWKSSKNKEDSIKLLMHFMQLEKMALPIRDIKMQTNVDTSKDTTVFDAYDRQQKIQDIRNSKAFPEMVVDKILNDSAISAFYIQDLQLAAAQILQPLRNSNELNGMLLKQGEKLNLSDKELAMFKNDYISYLWQKEQYGRPLFSDRELPTYKSRRVESKITSERAALPKSGVAVIEDVILLDEIALNKQFESKSFIDQQYFVNFGKAPIPFSYFPNAKSFIKFSIEREVQRSIKPLSEKIKNNPFFLANLENAKQTLFQGLKETTQEYDKRLTSYAYESFLRDEALMATLNIESIFKSPTSNFAERFFIVKDITPQLNKFRIFETFELDKKKDSKISNLKYSEIPDVAIGANALKEEINILKNPTLLKAAIPTLDNVEIEAINSVFNDFPIVAFLQTGLNTGGRYSINSIVEEEYIAYAQDAFIPSKVLDSRSVQDFASAFKQKIKSKKGRAELIRYKNFFKPEPREGRDNQTDKIFDDREQYEILVPTHLVNKEADHVIEMINGDITIKSIVDEQGVQMVLEALNGKEGSSVNKTRDEVMSKVRFSSTEIQLMLSTPERASTFLLLYQKEFNKSNGNGNFFINPSSVNTSEENKKITYYAINIALSSIRDMNEGFFSSLKQTNIQLTLRALNPFTRSTERSFESILDARKTKIDYTKGQADSLKDIETILNNINKSKGTEAKYHLLAGYAGTGKTTIAENILTYAKDQGFDVLISAPTNKAVNVLKSKLTAPDKDFNTLHKMLYGRPESSDGKFVFNEKQKGVDNTVFIVDEASMIDERVLSNLQERVNKGQNNLVVFLGDSFQLEPVGRDPKLFTLGLPGMTKNELTEVRRQSLDSDILSLATLMRTDNVSYEPTESSNDVKVIKNSQEFEQEFINDLKSNKDVVMITGSNADRVRINKKVRSQIYKADASPIEKGEKLIAIANRRFGYKNSETLSIDYDTEIEYDDVIDLPGHGKQRIVAIRLADFGGVGLIFPDFPASSVLDNAILTAANNNQPLFDYLTGENIINYNSKTLLPQINYSPESPLTLVGTYAYAITGHKSQGSQWNKVYVDQESGQFAGTRWYYTAITRAAEELVLKKSKFVTLITPAQTKSKIDAVIRKNATAPISAPALTKDLNETSTKVEYYEGFIKPEPNTVFVFGSNPEGKHGKGAAKIAKEQFGAIYGQGEGLQGSAYALPTKDLNKAKGLDQYNMGQIKAIENKLNDYYKTHPISDVINNNPIERSISPEAIVNSIESLYKEALNNPSKKFKIGYKTQPTEASLNGYLGAEMLELFNQAGTIPSNVIFSKEWFDTGKLKVKPAQPTSEVETVNDTFELDTTAKNLFSVEPLKGRPDKKAITKSKIATQYIGFGNNIPGSSTKSYANQAGEFANTGKYSTDDIVFVSMVGNRGSKKYQDINHQETIDLAMEALESGAVLITDNKEYTFNPENTYNTGEQLLWQTLNNYEYLYSQVTVDGVSLGVWRINDGIERKVNETYVEAGERSSYVAFPNFGLSKNLIEKYKPSGIMLVNGSITPNDEPGNRTVDELILNQHKDFSVPIISVASYKVKSGKAFSNVLQDVQENGIWKIDPKVQQAIDDRLDFVEKEYLNPKTIEFNPEGYGMDMLKTMPNSQRRIGVQTWLHLSEELFKRFGYINPGYNRSSSGSEVIQSSQGLTEVQLTEQSDQAVLDYLKMCKF